MESKISALAFCWRKMVLTSAVLTAVTGMFQLLKLEVMVVMSNDGFGGGGAGIIL
jgi:hypothetical protein